VHVCSLIVEAIFSSNWTDNSRTDLSSRGQLALKPIRGDQTLLLTIYTSSQPPSEAEVSISNKRNCMHSVTWVSYSIVASILSNYKQSTQKIKLQLLLSRFSHFHMTDIPRNHLRHSHSHSHSHYRHQNRLDRRQISIRPFLSRCVL
jgi:hypothetical protein